MLTTAQLDAKDDAKKYFLGTSVAAASAIGGKAGNVQRILLAWVLGQKLFRA